MAQVMDSSFLRGQRRHGDGARLGHMDRPALPLNHKHTALAYTLLPCVTLKAVSYPALPLSDEQRLLGWVRQWSTQIAVCRPYRDTARRHPNFNASHRLC